MGQVVEIVVQEDGTRAGILVESEQQQGYRYIPLHQLSMRGQQLVVESQANIATVTEQELRQQNFNRIPSSDRPLSDYVQVAELQQGQQGQ
jgi:hypothetical protein